MTCTVPTFVSVLPPSRLDSRGQCLSLQTTKRLSGRSVVAQSFHSSRILCSAAPNPSTSPTVQPVPKVEPSTPTPTAGGFTDPSFIEAVSGEWFGYQVTFSGKTGAPQEIDERYVPEEYRNWGVSITGFDTLTSTTVKDDVLSVKFTRALPTVGCEADAIAGEVSETTYTAENGFCFPDGSYIIVPRHFDKANLRQKFSACITHPNATAAAAAGDARRRARVQFGRVDERASRVSVVLERWDSPFCDGAILPGCGGPDSSFANEDRSASDMIGKWTANVMRLSLSGEEIKSNSTEREEGVVEEMMMMKETLEIEENHTVDGFLLPRGLSIRILTHGQAQKEGNVVEVAWLVPDGGQKKCSVVRGVYTEEGILKYLEHAVGSVST